MSNKHHFLTALAVCTLGAAIVAGVLAYPGCDGKGQTVVVGKEQSVQPSTQTKTTDLEISILFAGDMMFDRTVKTRTDKSGDTDYPFRKIGSLKDGGLGKFDYAVANLEGPISVRRPPVKSIDFAFTESILPVLKRAGIDAVSQANNHTLDQGRQGATDSRTILEKSGLVVFGDQVKDDPGAALSFVDIKNKRVALLGFNDTDNPIALEDAKNALLLARETADYTIVMPHWGQEYKDKPNKEQINIAHWFIDNGADAVIGGHPHWMQSVEVYKGKFVAYSLGNFIFDQDWSEETGLGLALGLHFRPDGVEVGLFPVAIRQSQPVVLTGAEKAKRLEHLAQISDPKLGVQIKSGILELQP